LQHVFQVPSRLIEFYINKNQVLSELEHGMNATREMAIGR
jgi:hypothetical protein